MSNQVAISHFKSHCLELINSLPASKKDIIITKRNKPIAQVSVFNKEPKSSIFGALKDRAKVKLDIVKSSGEEWSVEND